MRRPIVLYFLLVCVPAMALALFAFRAADMDHERETSANQRTLEIHADGIFASINKEVLECQKEAEKTFNALSKIDDSFESSTVQHQIGFALNGTWIGYGKHGYYEDPNNNGTAEDLRLFELSLAGGESFELQRNEPGRALDAYGFYLPRIRSGALRARLRYRMARSALKEGSSLGAAILVEILRDGDWRTSEDGIPIEVLATLRLLECGYPDSDSERKKLLRRTLNRRGRTLPTPLLSRIASVYLPDEQELRDWIVERAELETAIRNNPGILKDSSVVIDGKGILFSKKISGGIQSALFRLEFHGDEGWDFDELKVEIRKECDGGPITGPVAWRVIQVKGVPENLGHLFVSQRHSVDQFRALDRKRFLQKGLVLLLIVSTLAGGRALYAFLRREREVARLRSRLLGNISHELRTPITSIRMLSELLAEKPGDAESTKRFADLLQAEGGRLGGLIENLLEYSRLGRKEVDLPREPVDLAALLDRTAAQFRLHTARESVDFRWERPEGLPAVLTHAPAVERIVLNLLENALKYRRKEGPWIRLAAIVDGRKVLLSVADNGLGIRPEDRERIFEEFYRVRYDDYAVPGSGLGLPISRRLARKLGGGIRLESRPGEGSTFTLEIPLEEGPVQGPEAS